MRFYLATSFIFPRSLRLRLFTLCFVTTHLPLIGYLGWGLASGRIIPAEFLLLTLATLVGTVVALMGIGALLRPVQTLAETLYRQDVGTPALPEVGDLISTLYAGVQRAAEATRVQISDLRAAAHEDPLTGIANRRGFLAHIEALPVTQRSGCIAMVDIDHFKQVNDRLGHDEGDRILAALSNRLSSQIRRADVVARWGGEEFVLFFQNAIEDEACGSLDRIARTLRDSPIGWVDDKAISFSAGVARWDEGAITVALDAADTALYEAKRSGRDRICRAAREKRLA